ncbi:hypothetical protein ACLOJK_028247 [Asimina triloba]
MAEQPSRQVTRAAKASGVTPTTKEVEAAFEGHMILNLKSEYDCEFGMKKEEILKSLLPFDIKAWVQIIFSKFILGQLSGILEVATGGIKINKDE